MTNTRAGLGRIACARPLAAAVLALGILLTACNGDDITALPEAVPRGPAYSLGDTNDQGSLGWGANTLSGTPVVVPRSTHLLRFGIIGYGTGPNFRMALYTDNAGTPFQLVAATPGKPLQNGPQEVAVPDQIIAAGNYWIMVVLDATTSIGANNNGTLPPYKTVAQNYGSPLPSTLSGVSSGPNHHINFWIVVRD